DWHQPVGHCRRCNPAERDVLSGPEQSVAGAENGGLFEHGATLWLSLRVSAALLRSDRGKLFHHGDLHPHDRTAPPDPADRTPVAEDHLLEASSVDCRVAFLTRHPWIKNLLNG